ncbi:hypothetical protein B0H16DRAFT_1688887 [Mycena metata]|uniref:Uncharacterized protein n=1 Tax=Mycena metata TaxID=1033252 RepID=A0AAD7NH19_9AGAR|nr:hypothetical protein B0H16DRAFT_1688887 [Mycena metata]
MVILHDLENTLSSVVASMFWTLGNSPPQAILKDADDGTIQISTTAGGPTLLQGHAEVPVTSVQGRLDIAAGLAASVALFLLPLLPSLFLKDRRRDTDVPIDGMGMLHAIWLYRNHPELQTLMEQVDEPTEANLREAGMRGFLGASEGGEVAVARGRRVSTLWAERRGSARAVVEALRQRGTSREGARGSTREGYHLRGQLPSGAASQVRHGGVPLFSIAGGEKVVSLRAWATGEDDVDGGSCQENATVDELNFEA